MCYQFQIQKHSAAVPKNCPRVRKCIGVLSVSGLHGPRLRASSATPVDGASRFSMMQGPWLRAAIFVRVDARSPRVAPSLAGGQECQTDNNYDVRCTCVCARDCPLLRLRVVSLIYCALGLLLRSSL